MSTEENRASTTLEGSAGTTPAELPVDQDSLVDSLTYSCLQAYLTLIPVVKKQLLKFKLRPVEFTILSLVQANPEINQKRLGLAIKVSPPNLATLLDRMEQEGLLKRQRNPRDKRSQILVLTARGQQLINTAKDAPVGAEKNVALEPAERQELLRLLQKIFLP